MKRIQFFRRYWHLARGYWFSEEKWIGRGLLAAVVALNLAQVGILVRINKWNNDFYNALQEKNSEVFQSQIFLFTGLAAIFVLIAVYKLYLFQMLSIKWRRWMTGEFLGRWLSHRTYYHLEVANAGTDNPDQRIAEDVRNLVSGSLSLGLGLLSSVVTLCSFVLILWNLSGPLEIPFFGTAISIPGYMVWCSLLYSLVGSVIAYRIGRPLVKLNFEQQRYEADFRFHLVRLRENAEGVALYNGEPREESRLRESFERIRKNWWELMRYNKRLTGFSSGFSQAAIIFPILVAAPRYFAGTIALGGLMQISSAFSRVQDALSWFIDSYASLAEFQASLNRLSLFEETMVKREEAHRHTSDKKIQFVEGRDFIATEDLVLHRPQGEQMLSVPTIRLEKNEHVLVKGPSGRGKSTLFRAFAGIWDYGTGKVIRTNGQVLFLPQKPYLPIGTLKEAVCYPESGESRTDNEVLSMLQEVQFPSVYTLHETAHWQQRLSPGEQQRLSFARAFLAKPEWLFLDEATSALDEESEALMYELLRQRLSTTCIVSIAHRPKVAEYHEREIVL